MEPWQQEEMHQRKLMHQQRRLPRCQCCDAPITTEYCLDLLPFGLAAKACQACVDDHMVCTVPER